MVKAIPHVQTYPVLPVVWNTVFQQMLLAQLLLMCLSVGWISVPEPGMFSTATAWMAAGILAPLCAFLALSPAIPTLSRLALTHHTATTFRWRSTKITTPRWPLAKDPTIRDRVISGLRIA